MAGAPFYGFAPTRQLPGQLEGLTPLVQGLGQFHQNQLLQQDLQNLATPQGQQQLNTFNNPQAVFGNPSSAGMSQGLGTVPQNRQQPL